MTSTLTQTTLISKSCVVAKIAVLCCLMVALPLCVLAEEAFVVLTSYEEYPAWQEEFDEHKGLFYPRWSYYSFGNERHGPDLIEVSGEESYLLFSDLDYLDAAKLLYEKGLQPEEVHHGYASYWVRVQLHVPQDIRVGVENFHFRNATDDVWVKQVLEEMDGILGEVWLDDKVPGLRSGEYHLRLMARKDVDLKAAIEEAELLCDVTWHPGTEKVCTTTIKVLSPYLSKQSYDQPVQVQVLSARQVPDEWARGCIGDTGEFWDNMTPSHYLLLMDAYDLWEVTAKITKETGYPVVDLRWTGTGVGGSWKHYGDGAIRYNEEADLEPDEVEGEVTFYVVSFQGSTRERQLNYLRGEEVCLEYATEYVGVFDYLYTPGPKYQVKVDMSKVEIIE